MKSSVILFFSIIVIQLMNLQDAKSQNYQTANSGLVRYYRINQILPEENIQASKIESADLMLNGDSVLYFYRIMRDTGTYNFGECTLDTNAACWMGTHIIVKPGGENQYFNKAGDTIRFNTQAVIGDSWLLLKQPDFYLEATVDSVSATTTNGVVDSVKIISLLAYSASGLPVENWFNSKQFRISKNHGFEALYSFYDFPLDTNLYKSYAYEPLTISSVYDFEVGDIFHFENGLNYGGPPNYEIETILAKWFSAGDDTIYYRKEEKRVLNELVWDPDPHIVTTIKTDTITVSYVNSGSPLTALMPNQKKHDSPYDISYNTLSSVYQKWNGRPTITFDESRKYDFTPDNNCFTGAFEPMYFYHSYTKGCGVSYSYYEETSASYGYYVKLKYFKKGTEIWGDPYILTSMLELPKTEPIFETFPNPFTDRIEIHIETRTPGQISLYLYSISGTLLLKLGDAFLQPGKYMYNPDLSQFAKGIYVMMFKSGDQSFYKKLIRN